MNKIVWAPDPLEGFLKGTVVDIGQDTLTVKISSSQKTVTADYDQVFPIEEQERDVDDNCALMYLNSPNLLNNIKMRYNRNSIYTYVANILISINPYFDIPNLYSKETIKKYKGKSIGTLPPHVFAIADQAYRDMKINKINQSIIVSGESGAGKTETTKYILQYLTECYGAQSGIIEQRIVESNPLLEAFGNAKTVRNNNSSRSGKFVEIHFDKKMMVTGAYIAHYVLEKSRICKQAPNERNYHIFYQLCAGMPQNERNKLELKSPESYNYLKNGTTRYFCSKQDLTKLSNDQKSKEFLKLGNLTDIQLNDVGDYKRTLSAMKDMGISDQECHGIFEIVAAILHLGNIEFEDSGGSQGGCKISDQGKQALIVGSRLLGFDQNSLAESLCNKFTKAAGIGAQNTSLKIALKTEDAYNARDALAKAIYVRIFEQIVEFVNRALPFQESINYVGILDIAGFEYFERNDFEQFCINYCNEKLQNFFNERMLNDEQSLYEKEGLGLTKIKFIDNIDCIEIIEKKSSGVIDILDEENKLPKPSAEHFTMTLFEMNPTSFRLQLPRKSKLKMHREVRDNEGFLIRHFAGAVCYHTNQFIEKNNDALHDSLKTLLETSTVALMKVMFEKNASSPTILTSNSKMTRGTGKLAFVSVASKFRFQLTLLMDKLKQSSTNFIRCIKPNVSMVSKCFEGGSILSQLQCSGMTVVLDLMQQGYPSRMKFIDLYNIYHSILPANLAKLDPKLFCKLLFKAVGLNEIDFRFGMTKVFFRPGKMAAFDQLIRSDPDNLKMLIAKVKSWLIRYRWRKAQYGVLEVIKLKNKIIWRKRQIIKIQKTMRMWIVKKKYYFKIKGLVKLRKLKNILNQMTQIVSQLKKSKEKGTKIIEESNKSLLMVEKKIKEVPVKDKDQVSKLLADVRTNLEKNLEILKKEVEIEKVTSEQEKIRKIKEEMENQKRKEEEAKRQQIEEENEKLQKIEIEKNRLLEEKKLDKKINEKPKIGIKELHAATEDYLQEQTKEQERRDKELAFRLAEGDMNAIEELSKTGLTRSKSTYGANDVTQMTYEDLRKNINQSCDLKLLEECQTEFHRRINAYNNWKNKQKSRKNVAESSPSDDINPLELGQSPKSQTSVNKSSALKQRYFSLPFKAPNGKSINGMWYGHFDGEFIARQIEVHDKSTKIVLLAGVDDLAMCDLPLSETGLTTKKGVEISEKEFEKIWKEVNGNEKIKKMISQITSKNLKDKFMNKR